MRVRRGRSETENSTPVNGEARDTQTREVCSSPPGALPSNWNVSNLDYLTVHLLRPVAVTRWAVTRWGVTRWAVTRWAVTRWTRLDSTGWISHRGRVFSGRSAVGEHHSGGRYTRCHEGCIMFGRRASEACTSRRGSETDTTTTPCRDVESPASGEHRASQSRRRDRTHPDVGTTSVASRQPGRVSRLYSPGGSGGGGASRQSNRCRR